MVCGVDENKIKVKNITTPYRSFGKQLLITYLYSLIIFYTPDNNCTCLILIQHTGFTWHGLKSLKSSMMYPVRTGQFGFGVQGCMGHGPCRAGAEGCKI